VTEEAVSRLIAPIDARILEDDRKLLGVVRRADGHRAGEAMEGVELMSVEVAGASHERLGQVRATKGPKPAMRMRGLEPPRGSEGSGVQWRGVEFAAFSWLPVTPLSTSCAGFTD
jgi:hypothetical protein